MKTVGIIAEYNPLHNGHLYQICESRRICEADFVIVAMSGDFVQRGEPAIYDKYTRTRMALNAGADLVLELPSCFATGSAEDFASCAVSLLHHLGVTDHICFGSECGDVKMLSLAAKIIAEEPEDYKKILKRELAEGISFPKARANALKSVIPEMQEDTSLLSSPNNILGMEYIKALIRLKSNIRPVTVLRNGSGYHDTKIQDNSVFASASAIRKALLENRENISIREQMPVFPDDASPIFTDDLSEILNYRLLDLYHTESDLTCFSDVSKELSDRLNRQILDFDTFSGRIRSLKTKQYTYTRISRALLHILLGIKEQDMHLFRMNGYASYARVLGFKKSSIPLLSEAKAKSKIPLITKTANAHKILENDAVGWLGFQYNLHASHLYQMIQQQKYGILNKNEFTRSPIILDD